MKYNPVIYWQDRGKLYMPNIDGSIQNIKDELAYLAEIIRLEQPATILDIGSGWGRTYRYLTTQARNAPLTHVAYVAADIVDSMRLNCQRVTGLLPDKWDGHTLPYSANHFDLVILSSVLLHVPPEDIERVFSEATRVCKHLLYIASHGVVWSNMADHCFWHDYLLLASQNKLSIRDIRVFNRGKRVNYLFKK